MCVNQDHILEGHGYRIKIKNVTIIGTDMLATEMERVKLYILQASQQLADVFLH